MHFFCLSDGSLHYLTQYYTVSTCLFHIFTHKTYGFHALKTNTSSCTL